MYPKLKASGIHLSICVLVASIVLAIVYFGWYQDHLWQSQGIGPIIFIVLAVDIILGPLLTFVVYREGKKSLKFDLFVIACLQLGFLSYGVYTVERARPAFLVFALDRFEPIATIDWPENESSSNNPIAQPRFLTPKLVGVVQPDDIKERERIAMAAIQGGPDITAMPRLYRDYDSQKKQVVERSLSLDALEKLNPESVALKQFLASLNLPRSQVGFLPLKGKDSDLAVVIDRKTGQPIRMLPLRPW